MKKRTYKMWIDKKKSLPEEGKKFEVKDQDNDIICGIGERDLKVTGLTNDDYLTHWRYVRS